jgi:hypothetical protein
MTGGSVKGSAKNDPYIPEAPAPANIVSAVSHVPVSELEAAGNGPRTGTNAISVVGKPGSGATIITLSGTALTSGGKPLLNYLGSEFCPYCAATRWPLTIALSRFGTFKNLYTVASTPLDIYGNTHTLSYAHATYTSPYLAFHSTEQLTNICPVADITKNASQDGNPIYESPVYECKGNYEPLQTTPASVAKLASSIDNTANFGSTGANGIPFIDFGGKYAESGASYSPLVLFGSTWDQIVTAFQAPKEGIGQAVLAAANRYTALICKMTNNKPSSVCDTALMKSAEKALNP